jgi:hypothetical protein
LIADTTRLVGQYDGGDAIAEGHSCAVAIDHVDSGNSVLRLMPLSNVASKMPWGLYAEIGESSA